LDSKKTKQLYVIAAIAAAVIISVIAYVSLNTSNTSEPTSITPKPIDSIPVNPEPNTHSTLSSDYKINTQCELLYAMTNGVYPDDTSLERLNVVSLAQKYPNEYAPWKDIISDSSKLKAFADSGFSPEFYTTFSNSVLKEYSINPVLQDTVIIALKPGGSSEIKTIYDNENCESYFLDRQNQTNP